MKRLKLVYFVQLLAFCINYVLHWFWISTYLGEIILPQMDGSLNDSTVLYQMFDTLPLLLVLLVAGFEIFAWQYINSLLQETKIPQSTRRMKWSIFYALIFTSLLASNIPFWIVRRSSQLEEDKLNSKLYNSGTAVPSEPTSPNLGMCGLIQSYMYDIDNSKHEYIGDISCLNPMNELFNSNTTNSTINSNDGTSYSDYSMSIGISSRANNIMISLLVERLTHTIWQNHLKIAKLKEIAEVLHMAMPIDLYYYESPKNPIQCLEKLRMVLQYTLFPRCDNNCVSYGGCRSTCLELKDICGPDLLKGYVLYGESDFDDYSLQLQDDFINVLLDQGLNQNSVECVKSRFFSLVGYDCYGYEMNPIYATSCSTTPKPPSSSSIDSIDSDGSYAYDYDIGNCSLNKILDYKVELKQFYRDQYLYNRFIQNEGERRLLDRITLYLNQSLNLQTALKISLFIWSIISQFFISFYMFTIISPMLDPKLMSSAVGIAPVPSTRPASTTKSKFSNEDTFKSEVKAKLKKGLIRPSFRFTVWLFSALLICLSGYIIVNFLSWEGIPFYIQFVIFGFIYWLNWELIHSISSLHKRAMNFVDKTKLNFNVLEPVEKVVSSPLNGMTDYGDIPLRASRTNRKRGCFGCFKDLGKCIIKQIKNVKKIYDRYLNFASGGKYGFTLLFFYEVFEILTQAVSVLDVAPTLPIDYLMVVALGISLNCIVSGALFIFKDHISPITICICDASFEVVYILVNIGVRSAAAASANITGNTSSNNILAILSIMIPLRSIQHKVIKCLKFTIRKSIATSIMNTDDYKTALKSLNISTPRTAAINDSSSSSFNFKRDEKQLRNDLIRSKFNIRSLQTNRGEMGDSSISSWLYRLAGLVMILFGIMSSIHFFQQWRNIQTHCEMKYGKCVWNGMNPKVYFQNGYFGELTCGESRILSITTTTAATSDNGECDLTLLFNTTVESNIDLFPQLQILDFSSNNDIDHLPLYFLDHSTIRNFDLGIGNPCLTNLSLASMNLTALPRLLLTSLFSKNLVSLDVSDNPLLSSFAFDLLNDFNKLERINLRKTNRYNLESISNWLDKVAYSRQEQGGNAKQFFTLDLNSNHITIDQMVVYGGSNAKELAKIAPYLKHLDLSSNEISDLPHEFVSSILERDENSIDLSNNPIISIEWIEAECLSMLLNNEIPLWVKTINLPESISLLGCNLMNIEFSNFHNMVNLHTINLSDNELTQIPDYLTSIPALNAINLNSNSIKSIDIDDTLATNDNHDHHPSVLRILNLDLNRIERLASTDPFKSLKSLEMLTMRGNYIQHVSKNVFTSLNSLKVLDLSSNRITLIHVDAFLTNNHLEEINFSNNEISELPKEVFRNQIKLKILNFEGNKIQTLPFETFYLLESVVSLNLNSNLINSLNSGNSVSDNNSSGVFQNMVKLRQLSFNNNQIVILPSNLLKSSPDLEIIEFVNNKINSLPADIFDTLTSLEILDLSLNSIDNIPDGCFNSLVSLVEIDLSINYLESIPDGLFSTIGSSLKRISIYFNRITNISGNAFTSLTGLQYLDLESNDLIRIPSFSGLESLEILILTENKLSVTLPGDIFISCVSLVELYLDDNNLNSLPETALQPLNKLQVLDAGYNNLEQLSPNLFINHHSLRVLNLMENNIKSLPADIFKLLTSLEILELKFNFIDKIPEGCLDSLVSLVELSLDSNLIESFPDGFMFSTTASKSLEYISLNFNYIAKLPDKMFASLTNLKTLSLIGNLITEFSENIFEDLVSLNTLYLSGNLLSKPSLPNGLFDAMPNLKILFLGYMDLEILQTNLFKSLTSLEILYIDENSISKLSRNLFQNTYYLRELHAEYNAIETLNMDLFANLKVLHYVQFVGNPLKALPGNLCDVIGLSLRDFGFTLSDDYMTTEIPHPDIFRKCERLETLYIYHTPSYMASCNYFNLPESVYFCDDTV